MSKQKPINEGYQPSQKGYQPNQTTTTITGGGNKVTGGYKPEIGQGGTQSNPPKKQ